MFEKILDPKKNIGLKKNLKIFLGLIKCVSKIFFGFNKIAGPTMLGLKKFLVEFKQNCCPFYLLYVLPYLIGITRISIYTFDFLEKALWETA